MRANQRRRAPKPRPPDFDFDATVEAMPEANLHCRDYGHAWRPFNARYLPDERSYEQVLRCTRCRAQRFRVLDSRGQVVSSRYAYKRGYLVQGMGRLSTSERGLIRLASVKADMP